MCTCGIQDRKDAWDVVADSVGVEAWRDYKAMRAASEGYTRAPKDTKPLTRAPSGSPQWVDVGSAYEMLKSELMNKHAPELYPMVFPLTVLHKFGGFARFTRRQKLTAVTGVSGGGKTLLLKTMMITLMQNGYDVIWWGPEWSPYEYAEQDLQRAGGLTMEQLDEWRLWKYYEARGVVEEMSARYGLKKPGDALIAKSIAKLDSMLNWPGTMYIVDPGFTMQHSDVMDVALGLARLKRAEGRDVGAFALDYVQLAQKKGARDWTWAEGLVSDVKVMCGQALLHGFVSTQVRKKDSEAVRDGQTLTQGGAQGLSDAQFNLYLTLTPDVDPDGKFLDTARLSVVKNSNGRKGVQPVMMDWQHLAVLDKEMQNINDMYKAGG
jgi:hypothetical protein